MSDTDFRSAYEVQVGDVQAYNDLEIALEFADLTTVELRFERGSAELEEILEVLTRLANARLPEIGFRGLVVTDLKEWPPEDGYEEEDD